MEDTSLLIVSVVALIPLLGGAWATATKDGPTVLGFTGAICAGLSMLWWPILPGWVGTVVVLVATALFVVGRVRPAESDDAWYWSALAVGLTGKTVAMIVTWVWGWLASTDQVSPWVFVISGG